MAQLPSRDWLLKFADAADAYRTAFRNVQKAVRAVDTGRMPAWCFALDRVPMEEIEKLSPELAKAALERRRRRVALHALSELIALTGDRDPQLPSAEGNPEDLMATLDGDGDAELDRFITIINYAKAGGVIYVNGTFEPVVRGRATEPPPQDRETSPEGE